MDLALLQKFRPAIVKLDPLLLFSGFPLQNPIKRVHDIGTHRNTLRWLQSRPARHEQGHLRRRSAQRLETHSRSRRHVLAGRVPVARLLDVPWILNIDTTVKPLYGHQEGAVISYNPRKPGRPFAQLPLLPDGRHPLGAVEVLAGHEHTRVSQCWPLSRPIKKPARTLPARSTPSW